MGCAPEWVDKAIFFERNVFAEEDEVEFSVGLEFAHPIASAHVHMCRAICTWVEHHHNLYANCNHANHITVLYSVHNCTYS